MEMYIPAIKNRNFISKYIEPARAIPVVARAGGLFKRFGYRITNCC
jgi:hypothetical protein